MNQPTELSPRARLLLGLVVMAAGLPIVLIGVGALKPDPRSLHAPFWVVTCAGLAFMLAGLSVALGAAAPTAASDGGLPDSAPWRLRFLQYMSSLAIVLCLAIVATYVGFGPGERHFTSTISVLGISKSGPGDEHTGRIVFGLGAVLCWLFLISIATHGWRRLFRRADPG